MRRISFLGIAASAIVLLALIPTPGHTQVVTAISTRGGALGYLGILNVRCDCTFRVDDDDDRLFTFRSNPVVLGIYEGSPADGSLERGDTITAIDGYALTSTEGGRRFANIRPGQRLTLNVSRGRARMTLLMHASSVSSGDERAFGTRAPEVADGTWVYEFPDVPAMPATPAIPAIPAIPPLAARPARPATPPTPGALVWAGRAPRAMIVQVPPAMPVPRVMALPGLAPIAPLPPISPIPPIPEVPPVPASPASPTGWFGFSIRCNECGWSLSRGDDSPVWESSSAPELSMISRDGPAARAGLMAGDRITHINGVSILTPAGARAFGRVRPGQKIRLTVVRDGKSLTRELTLATRPEMRAALAVVAAAPSARPARRELRYTGQLDNVSVEVWSAGGPNVERVGDTMTITVGGSVIRLKVK